MSSFDLVMPYFPAIPIGDIAGNLVSLESIDLPGCFGHLGAGMLHMHELQVLCCVCVVERDSDGVGNLAYY